MVKANGGKSLQNMVDEKNNDLVDHFFNDTVAPHYRARTGLTAPLIPPEVIDDKEAAASVIAAVTETNGSLERETGVQPGLVVAIVGDAPASHAYVDHTSKMANQCGFNSIQHNLGEETTQEELEDQNELTQTVLMRESHA